ncbi:MAG: SDR family NAD(P)-dependent oxidoreductase [Pseudomonadota bacterium]
MTQKNTNSIVITGASSGIGKAIAQHFSNLQWIVFAGYRKAEDSKKLQELGDNIHPIEMDITNAKSLTEAADYVGYVLGKRTLTGLVNNAGIARVAPLILQDIDEFAAHLSVNATGALRTAQAFRGLLGMDEDRIGNPGRIVTVTSVGGEVASPFLGAYTASKHAAESISDTLRRELIVYGIDSITIGPGSIKTPIWKKAKEDNAIARFKHSKWHVALKTFLEKMIDGGEDGYPPSVVATTVETALTDPSPKARYAPVPNKFMNYILPKYLPKRIVDKGFWKAFNIRRDGGGREGINEKETIS